MQTAAPSFCPAGVARGDGRFRVLAPMIGRRRARLSMLVSRAGARRGRRPVSPCARRTVTGTISSANRPSSWAATARRCDAQRELVLLLARGCRTRGAGSRRSRSCRPARGCVAACGHPAAGQGVVAGAPWLALGAPAQPGASRTRRCSCSRRRRRARRPRRRSAPAWRRWSTRLQAGAAAPVDLQAGDGDRQAGVEHGDAADRRGLAARVALAEDHVVDRLTREPGAVERAARITVAASSCAGTSRSAPPKAPTGVAPARRSPPRRTPWRETTEARRPGPGERRDEPARCARHAPRTNRPTTTMRAMDIDYLLTATRSARKSLDLSAPVDRDDLRECLRIGLQAANGSNSQSWRWVVVETGEAGGARAHLPGDLHRDHRAHPGRRPGVPHRQALRADHVVDRVAGRAPRRGAGHVIPCYEPYMAETRATTPSSSRRPTGRSSRRCGTSSSRCTPRATAPASPRCTSSAKPRSASCSASPRATCRGVSSPWVELRAGKTFTPRPASRSTRS